MTERVLTDNNGRKYITTEQDKIKQGVTVIDVVVRHEKEIQELKRLVTPMTEFNPAQRTAKCAVKDCENRTGQGLFHGLLCSPCHTFVSGEGGLYSQAYRNSRAMIDTAIEMERGRVAKFLEHLAIARTL